MKLQDFSVVGTQPGSDSVLVHAHDDRQLVLTFIPIIHLDDHLRRQHLTGPQANLVVERNIDTFKRIISAKYERGEVTRFDRLGHSYPRVDITLADIDTSGEKLTDSVLAVAAASGWVGQDGKIAIAE